MNMLDCLRPLSLTSAGMMRPRELAFLFLLVATLSGCWLERPETSYATMAEAKERGAIARGWIPDWIPASATNMREIHDMDTNESMLAFDIPASASWSLPADCRTVAFSDIGPPGFSRSWWPTAEEQESSYDFQRCAGDDPHAPMLQWVGRHKSGNRGLHWYAYPRQ